MVLPRRNVERALSKKLGMVMDQRDHRVYKLHLEGRFIAQTKVSRGTGHDTVGRELIGAMAHDLNVPTRLFREITGCTKGLPEYLQHLRDKGAL
jgi:hypothetical protein